MRYEFPESLLTSVLSPAEARQLIREHTISQGEYIACEEQFILQLWRDLSVQGHIQLTYMNRDYRDELYPSDVRDDYAKSVLNQFLDVDDIEHWTKKSESFDFEYAQEVLTNNSENFSEFYSDFVYDDEFSEYLLGYAVGKGLEGGDLQVSGQDALNSYLQTIFDERVFYKVDLEIIGNVPWDGVRYGELSPDQQMHLVTNLLNSREGSDKDWANVVVPHLLDCMAKHDQTADNVKALIRLNLPN